MNSLVVLQAQKDFVGSLEQRDFNSQRLINVNNVI